MPRSERTSEIGEKKSSNGLFLSEIYFCQHTLMIHLSNMMLEISHKHKLNNYRKMTSVYVQFHLNCDKHIIFFSMSLVPIRPVNQRFQFECLYYRDRHSY